MLHIIIIPSLNETPIPKCLQVPSAIDFLVGSFSPASDCTLSSPHHVFHTRHELLSCLGHSHTCCGGQLFFFCLPCICFFFSRKSSLFFFVVISLSSVSSSLSLKNGLHVASNCRYGFMTPAWPINIFACPFSLAKVLH